MLSAEIILASGSPFRGELMRLLGLKFSQWSPSIDESAYNGELAPALAARLSREKAEKVAGQVTDSLIIGADQVIDCEGEKIGKPGTFEKAERLLVRLSGKQLIAYSGICVISQISGQCYTHVEQTEIQLRAFSPATVKSYLEKEPEALFCAGGIKSEGLGMILIERLNTNDPHAIIGLPLYFLVKTLLLEKIELL